MSRPGRPTAGPTSACAGPFPAWRSCTPSAASSRTTTSTMIAHRNQHHQAEGCPSCPEPLECNNHVMQCPATSRRTWRTTTLHRLTTTGNYSFHNPILTDILRDGTQRWLQQGPPILLSDYPPTFHSLIVSQYKIGWSHLFRGRWSIEWKQHHEAHATSKGVQGNDADGTRWVRIYGKLFLQAWLDVWDIRNKERHGKDIAIQKEKRRASLLSQLRELYTFKSKVNPAHRHIFLGSPEDHIIARPNLDGLEDWINTFSPAIYSSAKHCTTIRQYFPAQGTPDR